MAQVSPLRVRLASRPVTSGLLPAPEGSVSEITEQYVKKFGNPSPGSRMIQLAAWHRRHLMLLVGAGQVVRSILGLPSRAESHLFYMLIASYVGNIFSSHPALSLVCSFTGSQDCCYMGIVTPSLKMAKAQSGNGRSIISIYHFQLK